MYNHGVTKASPQTKPAHTLRAAREAFVEAVEAYSNWSPGQPEPQVGVDDGDTMVDVTISEACRMVEACNASLPCSCRDTLRFCDIDLAPSTFATAAHALLARIQQFKQMQ